MPPKPKRYFKRYTSLPNNVFTLSLVSLLNDTSSEIIYPLLPAFLALTLGASPFAIGIIEGFAEFISSLLKLFSGYLSDKLQNRKLPIFSGYALSSLMRPLLAFVTSWQQVLFVRTADRIGKGIRIAPRDSLLASSVSEKKHGFVFGFNRAANYLGAVIGPAIAFVLLYFLAEDTSKPTAAEYKQIILLAAIPITLGLFVILFLVNEEKAKKSLKEFDSASMKFSIREFDGNFKRFLLIIFLFTLSNSTDAFLLLQIESAGIPLAFLPLLWMFLNLSKAMSSLICGDLSDKLGRKKLIFTGWILYAFVYCGFAFISNVWQALALFLVYGISFGLTEGVEKALVADLVPNKKRGTAYGLYNLAFSVAVFPASLLFGTLWMVFNASSAFLVSALISISAAFLILTIKNPKFEDIAKT